MILIGDIGNTDTKICIINSNYRIVKRLIFPTKKINNSFLFNKFNFIIKKKIFIKKALFCSVVPNKFSFIKSFFKKKLKIKCTELKNLNLNNIMKIKVNRKQVGSDRLANSIAVISKNKNFIILDFGTATTYDITNNKGAFIGGAIAPGIDVSADNLISKASLLKETVYQFPSSVIGDDTTSNIQSGVMFSGLYSVKGMINHIKNEVSFSNPYIILTGGFGKLISEGLDIDHIYNENLTIEGMIDIYKRFN